MSVTADEMLRRMDHASSGAARYARNKNLTASQRNQLAAPHLAAQNLWQQQYAQRNAMGDARTLQSDRLRTSTTNTMIGRLGLQRRAPGFGAGMYATMSTPEWRESTPNFYESGMPRLRGSGYTPALPYQDDSYGY